MTPDHPFLARERRNAAVAEVLGILLAGVLMTAYFGCWKPHPPEPTSEPDRPCEGDCPKPPTGDPSCETACTRARDLGCSWVKDTAEGGTCEAVCKNVQDSGIVKWNLACRTQATSCAEIDLCESDAAP